MQSKPCESRYYIWRVLAQSLVSVGKFVWKLGTTDYTFS